MCTCVCTCVCVRVCVRVRVCVCVRVRACIIVLLILFDYKIFREQFFYSRMILVMQYLVWAVSLYASEHLCVTATTAHYTPPCALSEGRG